jgi:hypothetical protein
MTKKSTEKHIPLEVSWSLNKTIQNNFVQQAENNIVLIEVE